MIAARLLLQGAAVAVAIYALIWALWGFCGVLGAA